MINRIISIKNHKDFSIEGDYWGSVFGLTDDDNKIHYTGQTDTNAYIARIPILLTSTIDDIGIFEPYKNIWNPFTSYKSGNTVFYTDNTYKCIQNHTSGDEFNNSYWIQTPEDTTGYTYTYTGQKRIDEFRRYGKTNGDIDLYNPIWNTDFSYILTTDNILKQITGVRVNEKDLNNKLLYDYKIWVSGNTGTTLSYSDIDELNSVITVQSSGLTKNNSIETEKIKLDYLIGVISKPKINVDVFIDRGKNSSFDKHMRLSDIKTLSDLENYGNGYFKIKEI